MALVPPIDASRARVAVLSMHTSPLDQPGTGDSGGMNVYVRALSERLADRGIATDVFTRRQSAGVGSIEPLGPLTRVVHVEAGPSAPVPKEDLPCFLPEFARGVLASGEDDPFDLLHAHYWLSGWAGRVVASRWGVPLVATFHTLGKVKDADDPGGGEAPARLGGEHGVVRGADRILASTPGEAAHLVGLYGARPERIRVVPPGVDPERFRPLPAEPARRALGLPGRRVVLYVGRLQRLKGADVAVRAFAQAVSRRPDLTGDLVLVVVGGPSSLAEPPGETGRLMALARELGLQNRVRFLPPVPHEDLPRLYAAADAVLVPSRSESFGLVALEAQACGVPVIASAVGGLRSIVADGESGFLVHGHEPDGYAFRLLRLLGRPALRARLSEAAVRRASRFSWERTADLVTSVYGELVPHVAAEAGDALVGA